MNSAGREGLDSEHHRAAVLFLDLNNFKKVNDTPGHAVGDSLLQQVAWRLHNCLRLNDTVSRHSEEEFTILVEDLVSAETVMAVLRKIGGSFIDRILHR